MAVKRSARTEASGLPRRPPFGGKESYRVSCGLRLRWPPLAGLSLFDAECDSARGCGSATRRYPRALIRSRTSVQVGNGRALARLYSSTAMTNSNCSSDIWPSSAALRSSLRRRPGPRRRSSPRRRSTTFWRRSVNSVASTSASFCRRSSGPSQRSCLPQGLSGCLSSAFAIGVGFRSCTMAPHVLASGRSDRRLYRSTRFGANQ